MQTPPTTPLEIPPLRAEPFTEDSDDGRRVTFVQQLFGSQDTALIKRNRQIEENVRMLAGQQWIVYSEKLGRFVDIKKRLTKRELRHKQRPVINRLAHWFTLNHARMTENPVIVAFEPQTADETDAELAESMDGLSKSLWHTLNMISVWSRTAAWILVGGVGYQMVRVDPNKGDAKEFKGTALLPGVDPVTGEPAEFLATGPDGQPAEVPFAPNDEGEFVPQARLTEDGEVEITGEAWKENEPGLVIDALNPLQVRGEWGNNIPWHEKAWHGVESLLTPDQIVETYGIDIRGSLDPSAMSGASDLDQIMRGTGYFGSMNEDGHLFTGQNPQGDPQGLVRVIKLWIRPGAFGSPPRTDDDPGGRLIEVAFSGESNTNGVVLRDGTRPAPYPYTSPVHKYGMIQMPGRPHESSPLEWLNPLQRLLNRLWAQVIEHTNLLANPKTVVDAHSNLDQRKITNKPGEILKVVRRPGVPAIEFVAPPRMNDDVFRTIGMVTREIQDLGNIVGIEGRIPSDDASGSLVRELRFNSDRFLGNPLRNAAEEYGRLWESVMATIEVIWDEQKLISWMGDDNMLRSVVVRPEMFKGKINVRPDLESMLPESRHERQERATELWQAGAFGDPQSSEAVRRYLDLARFPHMGRVFRPGGDAEHLARHVMGKISTGMKAEDAPVFAWYDFDMMLGTVERFMSTPEFLKMTPETQEELIKYHRILELAAQQKAFEELQEKIELQGAAMVEAGQVDAGVQASNQRAMIGAGVPQTEAAVATALAGPAGGDATSQPVPAAAGQ